MEIERSKVMVNSCQFNNEATHEVLISNTNDSNRYSYLLESMNLADSIEKTVSQASQLLDTAHVWSFHVEPVSPSFAKCIITDNLWFQENILCLIEQCLHSTPNHGAKSSSKMLTIRVSLEQSRPTSVSLSESSVTTHELHTVPESNNETPRSTFRPQSLVIPQRPSALNYSSRSHATQSPRTMRATIAFSPKYQSSLSPSSSSVDTEPIMSRPLSPSATANNDSTGNKSASNPSFLRIEVVQSYPETEYASTFTTNNNTHLPCKYPVHIMEHRLDIMNGRCGRPSSLPAITTAALTDNNDNKMNHHSNGTAAITLPRIWFFSFPYQPATSSLDEQELRDSETAVSGGTFSSVYVTGISGVSRTLHVQQAKTPVLHTTFLPHEQVIFTPSSPISRGMHKHKGSSHGHHHNHADEQVPTANTNNSASNTTTSTSTANNKQILPPISHTPQQQQHQQQSSPNTPTAIWKPTSSQPPSPRSSSAVWQTTNLTINTTSPTSAAAASSNNAHNNNNNNTPATNPSASTTTTADEKKKPVLLVDDSTMVLKLTRTVLERSGYVVHVARHGLEAVQTLCDLLAPSSPSPLPLNSNTTITTDTTTAYDSIGDNQQNTVDSRLVMHHCDDSSSDNNIYPHEELPVVLMDLQMPVIDGVEAVRRIRSAELASLLATNTANNNTNTTNNSADNDSDNNMRNASQMSISSSNRRLIILAMSANNHESIVQEALDAGCDAFLQKPFNLGDFEQVMQQILAFSE